MFKGRASLLAISLNKPKVIGRLQSEQQVEANLTRPQIPSSRASSINYNPVMSRQTSYRGDSFGEEGSKYLTT